MGFAHLKRPPRAPLLFHPRRIEGRGFGFLLLHKAPPLGDLIRDVLRIGSHLAARPSAGTLWHGSAANVARPARAIEEYSGGVVAKQGRAGRGLGTLRRGLPLTNWIDETRHCGRLLFQPFATRPCR